MHVRRAITPSPKAYHKQERMQMEDQQIRTSAVFNEPAPLDEERIAVSFTRRTGLVHANGYFDSRWRIHGKMTLSAFLRNAGITIEDVKAVLED